MSVYSYSFIAWASASKGTMWIFTMCGRHVAAWFENHKGPFAVSWPSIFAADDGIAITRKYLKSDFRFFEFKCGVNQRLNF